MTKILNVDFGATYGYSSFVRMTHQMERNLKNGKYSYEYECPSPDRSGNPFVPGFGTKDWNG
ncbi:hypothetical protein [Flavobacterium ginsenosidimutans]|uniref:Uncharacterized protein n=1 Tax=Flavobacterium ginsenosidimutans TaxID=687844 RepID=A0ABZ2QDQ5_9FLAO|nr:hypothetical protein [Flavobacterium ginsenosidimutans]KAF2329591.1 hypothetical protein DM444_15190 [Flavobacterium ginsenosidimutans]